MKLNLLPKSVAKEGQKGVFIALSILLFLICFGVSAALAIFSIGDLEAAKSEIPALEADAKKALDTAKEAETVIAAVTGIDSNLKLATAIEEHNVAHVNLYNEVLDYVPDFFRVTNLTATPSGESTVTVALDGVIYSFQQHADIMLALLRIPGATSVSRTTFTNTDRIVPGLNERDQVGAPIEPGQTNLPSDPMERMEALIARAAAEPRGFLNVAGFGGQLPRLTAAGPMPEGSAVRYTVSISDKALNPPDPRGTIAAVNSGAGAAAAPGGGFGGGAPFGVGSAPGLPPGAGFGGPPPGLSGGAGPSGPPGGDDDDIEGDF